MPNEQRKILTLVLVQENERILLGMKKRDFGAGRWNGFGGKVEAGEGIEAAAARELKEEAGIEADVLERVGILDFIYGDNTEIMEVHIFRVEKFKGEPAESEEMRPQWFNIEEIPFDSMWPDDQHWLPLFLEAKKFQGRFLFDEKNNILEHWLEEIEEI